MPAPTFHHCGEIEDELNNSMIFDIVRKAIEDAEHERDSAGNSQAKQRHAAQAVLLFQTALMSLERTVPVIAREEAALQRLVLDLHDITASETVYAMPVEPLNSGAAVYAFPYARSFKGRTHDMFAACPEVNGPETVA